MKLVIHSYSLTRHTILSNVVRLSKRYHLHFTFHEVRNTFFSFFYCLQMPMRNHLFVSLYIKGERYIIVKQLKLTQHRMTVQHKKIDTTFKTAVQ